MVWFHVECVQEQEQDAVVWNCALCRVMPHNIAHILSHMTSMKNDIKLIIGNQHKCTSELFEVKKQCEELKKQNEALQSEVQILKQQCKLHSQNSSKETLLLGDPLVKNIDQSKLQNPKVVSLPGARLNKALDYLVNAEESYKSIVCCMGTNDCSDENFRADEVTSTYKEVIKYAKTKVCDPRDVKVSSIPPRTDNITFGRHVESLNAGILAAANEEGISFINNDTTFKLNNGKPNDGYLGNDGLHLNTQGTNALAKNLQLR